MSSSISRGLFILVGLCTLLPGSQAEAPEEIYVPHHYHEHYKYIACNNILYSVTDLAFNLYQKPASWVKTSNVLLSPVSIVAAFAMLSLGTKGDTHMQILEGLKFNLREMPEHHIHQCFQLLLHIFQTPDHQLQLTMGSSLFVSDSVVLLKHFVEDVKELYYSEVIAISFGNLKLASKQINSYVEKESHGDIVNLVTHLEEDTDLILSNYISFHGKWTVQFPDEYTAEEDFYIDEETTVRVPMLSRLGVFLLSRDEELSSWVLVQHAVGDAMAFFILPDPGKMQQLEEGLTQEHFNKILGTMDQRPARIHFPQLSISASYDLRSILSTLGITKIFSDEADLSGISEVASIRLSAAMHKVMLTIDDKRTETQWPTNLEDSAWAKAPTVKFNRPFLLFIQEKNTKILLFMGKVLSPTQR